MERYRFHADAAPFYVTPSVVDEKIENDVLISTRRGIATIATRRLTCRTLR